MPAPGVVGGDDVAGGGVGSLFKVAAGCDGSERRVLEAVDGLVDDEETAEMESAEGDETAGVAVGTEGVVTTGVSLEGVFPISQAGNP